MTYHHLAEWLQGNLVMVDLTFNFDDTNNQFESQLDIMLDAFETGKFKEYVCSVSVEEVSFNFFSISLDYSNLSTVVQLYIPSTIS